MKPGKSFAAMLPRMLPGLVPGMVAGLMEGAQRAAVMEFPGPIERSEARDAALLAMLPLVPELGWSVRAIRAAAGPDADLLFPGGPAEMAEAHADLADRRMEAGASVLTAESTRGRVRGLILLRLEQSLEEREAIRRGLAVLSLPGNRMAGLRSMARTVDSIWHAAGDNSADASWYSKRAILSAVYGSTLLFWLRDTGRDEATAAFLDRRLAGVARIGRARGRFEDRVRYAARRAATCSGDIRTRAS